MFIAVKTEATLSCSNTGCRCKLVVACDAYIRHAEVESLVRERMAAEGWTERDIGWGTPLPDDWPADRDRRNLVPSCKACSLRQGDVGPGSKPKARRKAEVAHGAR